MEKENDDCTRAKVQLIFSDWLIDWEKQ